MFLFSFFVSKISGAEIIERLKCGVNIDGNKYDLEALSKQIGIAKIEKNGVEFHYSLCESINKESFLKKEDYVSGISVIGNDKNKNNSKIFGFLGTQSFDFISNDPNDGIKLSFYQNSNLKEIRESVFELKCDKNSENATIEDIVYESHDNYENFFVSYKTKYACPVEEQIVPKPQKQKNCHIISQKTEENLFHEFNLRDLDTISGYPLVTNDGRVAFYQPCASLSCPESYICNEEKPSSLWLCNATNCEAYGDLIDEHETSFTNTTASFKFTSGERKSSIIFTCDEEMPENNVDFSSVTVENNELKLELKARNVCQKPYDVVAEGIYEYERLDHSITINMTNQTFISEQPLIQNEDFQIYFDPTKDLECPKEICNTDRTSHGWNCTGNSCEAIAFSDEFPIYNIFTRILMSSVEMNYEGHDNSQLDVSYQCSRAMQPNQMRYENNTFSYDEEKKRYSMTIRSSDVCNLVWNFGMLSDTTIPPSKERPSPIAYEVNDTHSIEVDLSTISVLETSFAMESTLGGVLDVLAVIVPFTVSSCPIEGACIGSNASEGFICSGFSNSINAKCVPMFYSMSSATSSILGSKEDMKGITVEVPGIGNIKTQLKLHCGQMKTAKIVYDELGVFVIDVYNEESCPTQYFEPEVPPVPMITPEPPEEVPEIKLTYQGKTITYDKEDRAVGGVYLKTDDKEQRISFFLSPGNVGECPKSANCFNSTLSSVWKCWSAPTDPLYCLPVGDARWGVDIKDNKVTYKDGYDGYSTTITGTCGTSVGPMPPSYLYQEGNETSKHISLLYHHHAFCSQVNPDDQGGKDVTTSDVLFYVFIGVGVIAIALILYLVIGMFLVKRKTGKVGIPNSEFWTNVFTCKCSCCRCCCSRHYLSSDCTDKESLNSQLLTQQI